MHSNIQNSKNVVVNSSLSAGGHIIIGDNIMIVEKPQYLESSLSIEQIKKQFREASFELADYQNHFGDEKGIHIDRNETKVLYDWITNNNTGQNSIALLLGEPGYGKSVILKDLWNQLNEEEIVVLGIKADRYYVESTKELQEKLGLEESIIKMVSSIVLKNKPIVILIDQIDALSLARSIGTKYLNTYRLLIEKLSQIEKVKIIVSCRNWDLKYDPYLEAIQTQKKIKVGELTDHQISSVLKKVNLKITNLSTDLINLGNM